MKLIFKWIIKNKFKKIKVFTTRPDTIFGASFIALSVDHPIAKNFEKNKDFLSFKSRMFKNGNNGRGIS